LRRIRSNDEGVDGFIKNEELTKTTGLRHLLTLHRDNNKSQLAEKDGLLHQWLKELAKEKCVILTKWRSFEPMDNPSEQYNNRGQKYDCNPPTKKHHLKVELSRKLRQGEFL
jgi:hypothetical protein